MNTFGRYFRVTTWGESHGRAIGAVVDGCPAGLEISEADIQKELDLRRPGQSEFTSPRKESDKVEILSGVFEGITQGTPISLVIFNQDMRPGDYEQLKNVYRPGHADYTYEKKYGLRDYRGGGRSSGRETLARVAAGALARKLLLQKGIFVLAFARMIGGVWLEDEALAEVFGTRDAGIGSLNALASIREKIYRSSVRCPHVEAEKAMQEVIRQAAAEQDSVGGIVEARAYGIPAGLGEPVFNKINALVGQAILSIGAVKGIEFGDGFRLSSMKGSQANDVYARTADGSVVPATNRAGGVAGGITTGLPIICRASVKPTASIGKVQKTVDAQGQPVELSIRGRHDPCIVIRLVPVVEHMINLVLIDLLLSQRAIKWD